MGDARCGHVLQPVSSGAQPPGEVHILAVHEQMFVKTADRRKSGAPDGQRRAAGPACLQRYGIDVMPCFIGKLTALKRRRFLRRAHGGLVQAEEYVGPDFGVQIQKKQQRRAPFCRAAVACRAEPKVRAVFRHGKAAESRVFPCHAPQLLQCAVGGAVVGENKVQLLQRILHGGQRGHTCAQPFHAVVGHHHDIITHGVFSLFHRCHGSAGGCIHCSRHRCSGGAELFYSFAQQSHKKLILMAAGQGRPAWPPQIGRGYFL